MLEDAAAFAGLRWMHAAWSNGRKAQYVISRGQDIVKRLSPGTKKLILRQISIDAQRAELMEKVAVLGGMVRKVADLRNAPSAASVLSGLQTRQEKLLERAEHLWADRNELVPEITRDFQKLLSPNPGSGVIPVEDRHDDPGPVDNWIREFERFIGGMPKQVDRRTIKVRNTRDDGHEPHVQRSYFRSPENEIFLRQNPSKGTVWHEMGHWLEDTVPGASAAAEAYLQEHADSGTKTKLSDLDPQHPGYSADEAAHTGEFLEPYIGKVYREGGTEVTSMGMQYLAQDPGRLYQDQDHLAFTLGMIVGGQEGGFPWAKSKS